MIEGESESKRTTFADLLDLMETGVTQASLTNCSGLAQTIFDKLDVHEVDFGISLGAILQEVLSETANKARKSALSNKDELFPHLEPSFQAAAAAELLGLIHQESFREIRKLRRIDDNAWENRQKHRENHGPKRHRALRAGIWTDQDGGTVRKKRKELLAIFESATMEYISEHQTELRVFVTSHLEPATSEKPKESELTTSAALDRPPNLISAARHTVQAREALVDERVGKPLSDYAVNPLLLGVQPAIDLGPATAGLEKLPLYVPRLHDDELAKTVARATAGESAVVMLVGELSTGRTRACWEAVRNLGDEWRLWYPISPGEPEALLDGIARVGPRTVIWLNEVKRYLGVPLLGQQCAAHLRELLSDNARAPVLVLGTIWQRDWTSLMVESVEGGPDSNYQARALLTGSSIEVPDAFTSKALADLRRVTAKDPRLADAERMAHSGQITQYLAGVPEVNERYRTAPAVAKALIHAAMDARRLEVEEDLPLKFFAHAAPGYLTDVQWNQTKDNWLQEALDWTNVPCKGVLGPLTRIKPRTYETDSGPSRYRLAEHLAQQGRFIREAELPPATFWEAATTYAEPRSQEILARAAFNRGLFRLGVQLGKNSMQIRRIWLAGKLIKMIAKVSSSALDDAASWVIHHIDISDVDDVRSIAMVLRECQASDQLSSLFAQAAREIAFTSPDRVDYLIEILRNMDHPEALAVLLARDPASQVRLAGGIFGGGGLLKTLREIKAYDQADILADRVAADRKATNAALEEVVQQVDVRDTEAIIRLLHLLNEEGATAQLHQLLGRDLTSHVALDNAVFLGWLFNMLEEVGTSEHLEKLAARVAAYAENPDLLWWCELCRCTIEFDGCYWAHLLPPRLPDIDLSQTSAQYVYELLDWTEAGKRARLAELIERSAAKPEAFHRLNILATLMDGLFRYDRNLADDLVVKIATRVPLANTGFIARLLGALRELNRESEIAALLAKNPASALPLDDAGQAASLLRELHLLGREDQISTLLNRRSLVKMVSLAPPSDVSSLLEELASLGHRDHVLALATRAASNIECGDASEIVQLIKAMHDIGAVDQIDILATRAVLELDLSHADVIVTLLRAFHELKLKAQMALLLSRDLVTTLRRTRTPQMRNDVNDVANLLETLHTVDADAQVENLVTRLATEPGFIRPHETAALASAMRSVGAHDELEALAIRVVNSGKFDLYLKINPESAHKFRFGRDPDGTPSQPWGWHDLD